MKHIVKEHQHGICEHREVVTPRPLDQFDPNKLSAESLAAWKTKLSDPVEYRVKCSEYGSELIDLILSK